MVEAANRIGDILFKPREPNGSPSVQVAPEWALFLDVDGTLLPIATTPDAVVVSTRLRQALRRALPAFGGAVALISGRTIATLDQLFAPLLLPAAGVHGLERRDAAGTVHRVGVVAGLDDVRAAFAVFEAAHAGVLLEDKGSAVVLHFRQAPEAAMAARRLVAGLIERRADGIRVLEGKMMLEIVSPLADKGTAIAAFMGETPFAGRRPVFVGDDVTDEDGFAMVNGLGGYSVRVGAPAEPSAATYHLADVAAVVDWLEALPGMLKALPAGGLG
jgi:trehalose 6-phosphate phosphatase